LVIKKTAIILAVIISLSILSTIKPIPVYADATVDFVDGGANTGISSNCSARTTLATLSTSFPAGDNIIIAPVQAVSSDTGTENVDVRLYKSTTLLVQNEFTLEVGTSGKGGSYTLLYKDTGAASSPVYTVEVCTSATAVNAEAKILAVNGFIATDFADGTSQALGTGDTTITTKTTSFNAGNNVVIASVSIDNGGTAQDVAAAGIRLKNNAGSEIASNQYAMSFGTAAATDIQNILLVATDASAPANSAYTVTGKSPNTANGEAKLLIFQPKSYANNDSGSTGIGTGSTTLATLNTSFTASTSLGFVTTTQVDDTDSAVESIAIGDLDLNEASELSSNQYAFEAFAASGSAGDGFSGNLVYKASNFGASPTFTIKALASATGLNGEAKVLAFEVANPVRFYLRASINPSTPTNGEKSTALPVGTFSGNSGDGFENLLLSTTKGSSQTSKTITSALSLLHQDMYLVRFSTPSLAAQTISANTWTLAVAVQESDTNAQSQTIASIYVYRPSTGATVGYVYDSDTALGVEFTTSEDGQVYSLAGSSVTAQDGDILVFEYWVHATQLLGLGYVNTLYFDGTTDVLDSTTSDAASYLSTPQVLTFGTNCDGCNLNIQQNQGWIFAIGGINT